MNKLTTVAMAAALLATAVFAGAEPIQLCYKLHPGDIDSYSLAMEASVGFGGLPGAPKQPMKVTANATLQQKVLKVFPDGSANVRMRVDRLRLSGPGMTSPASKPVSVVLRITPDGRVLSMEGLQGTAPKLYPGIKTEGFMGQLGIISVFPADPVEVGESWYVPIPIPFVNQTMDVCSTLVSDSEMVGGVRATKISQIFEGTFDLGKIIRGIMPHVKTSTRGAQGRAMVQSIAGSVDLGGNTDYYISPELGKVLRVDGNVALSTAVQAPAQMMRQEEPTSVEMSISLRVRLVKL